MLVNNCFFIYIFKSSFIFDRNYRHSTQFAL